jgi:hypothetical protein
MTGDSLEVYKNSIGGLLEELLVFFVDEERVELTRRWAGLLLVELLGGSRRNRERVLSIENSKLYVSPLSLRA